MTMTGPGKALRGGAVWSGENDQLAELPRLRAPLPAPDLAAQLSRAGAGADQCRADHAGAVRRAAGAFLGQSFRDFGRPAGDHRPRRAARVRGDPSARARPVRGHAVRGRAAPGDAALSRPGPVDRAEQRGGAARPALRPSPAAGAGAAARDQRESRPRNPGAAHARRRRRLRRRRTSPNSPGR